MLLPVCIQPSPEPAPAGGVITLHLPGGSHIDCLPAQIIPKGIPEPGLVAQVLVSKFCDRQPLYHQQQVFAQAGWSCR